MAGTKAAVRVQARYLGGGEVLRADVGRGEDVYRMNDAPAMRCTGWCLRSTRIWVGFRGRPAVDFLVAKLEPNAAIETRSAAFNVEVIDGGSLTGVIAAETGLTVALALAVAASEVLPRTSIPSLKASAISLIPEGFETTRPSQAMADLLAWTGQRADQNHWASGLVSTSQTRLGEIAVVGARDNAEIQH